MRAQAGFTLIELIASVVLLGIIAVFGGMFLVTGIRGTMTARQAEENSQRAQLALARIALELRDVNGGPGAGGAVQVLAGPPRIIYTTSRAALSGTRTLGYDATGGAITLLPNTGGTARLLLDGVTSCTMSFSGAGATTTFTVSFTLQNSTLPFSITVKPRNSIVTPVTS